MDLEHNSIMSKNQNGFQKTNYDSKNQNTLELKKESHQNFFDKKTEFMKTVEKQFATNSDPKMVNMITNSGTDGHWQGPNGERPNMRGK